jgi:MFS family permease
MRHTFRSLRHRNFRLYYLGQLVSLSGTWMQSLAQAWLLYRLTGSGFMLGLAGAATLLPSLFLGVFGGLLADRVSRQRLLLFAQGLAMLQALVLAALTLSGVIAPWHVLTLALLLGVVQAFELPARHAFVVGLVPKADLANAIALHSSLFQASRLIGPAIAGVLVAVVGEGWVFLLNGLTFVAVLATLRAIRLPAAPAVDASEPKDLRTALRYAWQHRPIRAALSTVAVMSVFGTSAAVLLPVFAVKVYGVGAGSLGLLMGAAGAGALVGAVALARRPSLVGIERLIVGTGIATGGALLLFALTPVFAVALAFLAVSGFCITRVLASSNTFIQMTVPDQLRGRVMALFSVAMQGMMPLGSLAAGAAGDLLGAPLTVAISGMLLAGAIVWLGRPLRAAERIAQ